MDQQWPQPTDNATIAVHVKLLTFGADSPSDYSRINFNRVLDRLRSMGCVSVSENPPRFVCPRFVVHPKRCRPAWGELQCHRKIFGFIGVAFASQEPTVDQEEWIASFRQARCPFETALLDSRLVLLDRKPSSMRTSGEQCLYCCTLGGCDGLENGIKDFIKSLFWVLESRRLDTSYLKMDNAVYPKVPGEDKCSLLPVVSKRTLRKRCIGRWKKQIADYTLMTGLASLAMQEYEGAIALLRAAGDSLWLAAALEGYACSAVAAMLGYRSASGSLVRVNTFSEGDFKRANEGQWRPQGRLEDSKCLTNGTPTQLVLDTFVQALANYKKLPFASKLELECAFKAAHLLVELKSSCLLNQFFTHTCCKFLDDDFKQISDEEKGRVCLWMASLYLQCGFWRKHAFYCRLAALFFISDGECQPNSKETYRSVYPLLLKALDGYTRNLGSPVNDEIYYGWPGVQVNTIHEVHVAALRAGYETAAIRHLVFLLQHLYASLEPLHLHQYSGELRLLCNHNPVPVNKPLQIDSAIFLPPVSISNLPRVMSITFKSLSDDYGIETGRKPKSSNIFIYSPFECDSRSEEHLIAQRMAMVEVTLLNPTAIAVQMSNFSSHRRCTFTVEPNHVTIPANSTLVQQIRGKANEAGSFKTIGYSFQIFGVISVCRVESIPWLSGLASRTTQVLPEIPFLNITVVSENENAHVVQRTIYAGQTVTIGLKFQNTSEREPIMDVRFAVERTMFQGPETLVTLEIQPTGTIDLLGPHELANFRLLVTCHDGVDFAGGTASRSSLLVPDNLHTSANGIPVTHSTVLQVEYTINGQDETRNWFHCRAIRPIELTIQPAVIMQSWTVLAGESWLSRHLAIDLYNATDDDVELHITAERKITVLPGDSCRIPILVQCYQWPMGDNCRLHPPSGIPFEQSELCKAIQAYIMRQINLRWSTGREMRTGRVPLPRLLNPPAVCHQFCAPPFLLETSVENCQATQLSSNELCCVANRPVRMGFRFELLENCSIRVTITLHFFMDLQNGLTKDMDEEVIPLGPESCAIVLCPTSKNAYEDFSFMFCCEGPFQARVICNCTYAPVIGNAFQYSPLMLPVLTFQVSNE
uniref:Trafficking protein particle complex subunit 11 domain-containing protein n=1 Tax=Trichuris muris TaxID=70415 RepID=A0A5S6Q560_TRIMR